MQSFDHCVLHGRDRVVEQLWFSCTHLIPSTVGSYVGILPPHTAGVLLAATVHAVLCGMHILLLQPGYTLEERTKTQKSHVLLRCPAPPPPPTFAHVYLLCCAVLNRKWWFPGEVPSPLGPV